MRKETLQKLACNPANWQAENVADIAPDLAHYAVEHGHAPEFQGEEGIFLIGYAYLLNPQEKTIYPLNPLTGLPYSRDAREMFQMEEFNQLTEQLFTAPPGSLFLWISPADRQLNHPFPRIYLGQVKPEPVDDRGNFLLEAIDFNNDFSLSELRAILASLGQPTEIRRAKVIPPDNHLNNIGDLLEWIEEVITRERGEAATVHGLPFALVKEQWQQRKWEEIINRFRKAAEEAARQIYPRMEANDLRGVLATIARFEEMVAAQGGFFAPQSSCGAAVKALLNQNYPFLGIPSSISFLPSSSPERGKKCPACGHRLTRPVAVGEACPHCGAIRRC